MKKGYVQTVLFHQRWCKDTYHIKLFIWLGVERQVRVEERRNTGGKLFPTCFFFKTVHWNFTVALLCLLVNLDVRLKVREIESSQSETLSNFFFICTYLYVYTVCLYISKWGNSDMFIAIHTAFIVSLTMSVSSISTVMTVMLV